MTPARTYRPGDRVALRPDRADAYGLLRGEVYTVSRTWPDRHGYKRTWVALAELPEGDNAVQARELRPAKEG